MKGDNNGDGRVLTTDQPAFNTAKTLGTAGCTQSIVFVNDFNGDRRVLTTDQPGLNAAKAHSPTCP
jgi:hypothetical protein